jgi:hypothetical protein
VARQDSCTKWYLKGLTPLKQMYNLLRLQGSLAAVKRTGKEISCTRREGTNKYNASCRKNHDGVLKDSGKHRSVAVQIDPLQASEGRMTSGCIFWMHTLDVFDADGSCTCPLAYRKAHSSPSSKHSPASHSTRTGFFQ